MFYDGTKRHPNDLQIINLMIYGIQRDMCNLSALTKSRIPSIGLLGLHHQLDLHCATTKSDVLKMASFIVSMKTIKSNKCALYTMHLFQRIVC